MLPFRARQVPMMSSLFRGMVVSSEDSVRRRLAELLRQSGLTPVLASTVADSQVALARDKVCMLLCDEMPGRWQLPGGRRNREAC